MELSRAQADADEQQSLEEWLVRSNRATRQSGGVQLLQEGKLTVQTRLSFTSRENKTLLQGVPKNLT